MQRLMVEEIRRLPNGATVPVHSRVFVFARPSFAASLLRDSGSSDPLTKRLDAPHRRDQTEKRSVIQSTIEFRIKSIDSQVPEDFRFAFEFPVGTEVYDECNLTRYVVSDVGSLGDAMADGRRLTGLALRQADLPAPPRFPGAAPTTRVEASAAMGHSGAGSATTGHRATSFPWIAVWVSIGALGLAVVVGLVLLRSRRGHE